MKTTGSIVRVADNLIFVPDDSALRPFYLKDLIEKKARIFCDGWDDEQMDYCELEVNPVAETFVCTISYSGHKHRNQSKKVIHKFKEYIYERLDNEPIRFPATSENAAFEIAKLESNYTYRHFMDCFCNRTATLFVVEGGEKRQIYPEEETPS